MMTTQQILSLSIRDINKMTEKELRQAVSTLRSTGRKRYERIVESEVYSPAIKSLWHGAKGDVIFPTVRGMDSTTLKNEFKRYKSFLEKKTSTVAGAKRYEKAQQEVVEMFASVDIPQEKVGMFWDMVERAKDTSVGGVLNYKTVGETVEELMVEHPHEFISDPDAFLKRTEERLIEIYERENVASAVYPSKSMRRNTNKRQKSKTGRKK